MRQAAISSNPLPKCVPLAWYRGMKNLPGTRTLRGPATIKGSLRPFYQHAWPADLPPYCQICGEKFRTGWNLQIGPNRIGRTLRKVAYFSFLPCMLGFIFLPDLLFHAFGDWIDDHVGWLTFLVFVAPMLLGIASFFTPITRHVACKKCGWSRDFPRLKPAIIPPPQVSS